MDNAIYKEINFNGELKNAKVSNGGDVVIQLSAKSEDVDMNLLGEIMKAKGGIHISIESHQTELVDEGEESDGQIDLLDQEEDEDED